MAVEPISACVISYNEEDRIARCLSSLSFCDEILVVDSLSEDRTREIAVSMGARVEVQPFLGYVAQKNRALELAHHRWIFALDCDEWVTEDLAAEIRERWGRGPGSAAGFTMPRRNLYLGKVIRHGLFGSDRKLRLFHRERGRWTGTDPHDRVVVDGPVERLRGAIGHDSYRGFREHLRVVDRYSRLAAEAMHRQGKRCSLLDLAFRPPFAAFKDLVLKAGFLDGWRGFVLAAMGAWYNTLKYARLRALQRQRAGGA